MNPFQIYLFLLGCTCAAGWIRWRYLDPILRWVVILVNFTFIIEGIAYYLLYIVGQPATFLYHFSNPVVIILWLTYFAHRGFSVRWIWLIGVVFVIFHGLTSFWITLEVNNSPSNALRATILIGLAMWSMHAIFNQLEEENLLHSPHFWIAFGLIVFFGGSYVYLGLQSWLMKDKMDLAAWLHYYLLFGLNLVYYSSLMVSFLCRRKT